MAELVLGAVLPLLIEKLASVSYQYLLDFISSVGVDELLEEWRATLQRHRDVLEDAEEKQVTNREVRRWLDDLHDLLYDVDDFVDELAYEAQARRIKSSNGSRATTSKFPNCISAASLINNCGIINPAASKFYHKMKPKIDDISHRLQVISNRRVLLELKQINIGGRETGVAVPPPLPPTTSLPPSRVIGREKDKKEIVDMLLKPEVEASEIPVITIVGMGGTGKTTLAQDIYHDENVVKCFDLKVWVCVSDVFDVASITKTILASRSNGDKLQNLDLNKLQEELKEMLSGKRFLLVLDDIWNEDYGEWDVLRRPFRCGEAGSRILATTRNKRVASTMSRTNEPYVLSVLGDDDGLSLLALHALGREDFHDHRDLKESGEQLVKKCGRLPLAIKTIAGLLLHIPRERPEWEDVLNNKRWAEESHGILPALRLSYYHLPYHLKQCFAYCSIIPKDYIFNKTELVLLWMAEGLLQQPVGGSKQMEDFGRDCFQELLSRSFFQLTSGSSTEFIMHDLINDLAVHVAGERCFRMDEDRNDNRENYKISDRTRHLSFICQEYEATKKFVVFNTARRSRTLLALPHMCHRYTRMYYISDSVLVFTLSQLQSLRVLNLRGCQIVELPHAIGALKHLRYLNLSYTNIEQLPHFVCSLYNLQALSLNHCFNLRELPSSIGCLTNLRHLGLKNTYHLEKMPSGLGKLTSLQALSKKITVMGATKSFNLKDLKDLRYLHGTLSIESLENVTDDQDAATADLRSKEYLEILELRWGLYDSADSSRDRLLENRVLENLQPHCNLKVLDIEGYGGTVGFPSWVGGQSTSNVVKIRLHGCSKVTHLPPLGELPLLKDLVIEGLVNITSVGAEFYGGCAEDIAFPSLKTLSFCKMMKWNVWSPPVVGKGLFPRLCDLEIDDCQELGSIPTLDLPFLGSLKLKHCKEVWFEILTNLRSLKKMWIEGVAGLTCLPEQFVNSLVSLEIAMFQSCSQLGFLWHNNGTCLEGPFNCLNRLDVSKCDNLISLLEEGEQGLPRNLEDLRLEECANLEKLPNGLHGLESLQRIRISGCPSLVWDASDWLPKSLQTLKLQNCPKLESSMMRSSTFLDDGNHSIPSVKTIHHEGCTNIIRRWSYGSLTSSSYFVSLTYLSIKGCPGLESFRVTCLPMLRRLEIEDCADLKSLPDGIQGLASLKYMEIKNCGNLQPIGDKDLPPSLIDLTIRNVGGERKKEKSVVLSDWGFHRLTSLQTLDLRGFEDAVLFVLVVGVEGDSNSTSTSYLFPPSLTSLSLRSFPNLKSLSNSIQNLTSLRYLTIGDCPKLESLAGADDDEASLQIISSLHWLSIKGKSSEVLIKRCKKEKGKYWPTIQHIPRLVIANY